MTIEMEKRFYHERIRKPREGVWLMYRALIQTVHDTVKRLPPGEICHGFSWDEFGRNLHRFKADPRYEDFMKERWGFGDPTLGVLIRIGSWMLSENVQAYVFTREFFKILMKTKTLDFTWGLLPEEFLGVIRFPDPIIDNDGDPIREVAIAITPRDKALLYDATHMITPWARKPGSRILTVWYEVENGRGGQGYFNQVIPDDPDARIWDTWDRSYSANEMALEEMSVKVSNMSDQEFEKEQGYIFSILKALVYVNSGNPDLREFRNKIRYQSDDSKTPVRDHKPYSELDYNLVGWNWKKERELHTDAWGVEPFLRRQRVGPGRTGWRYVMVKEHTRSWKDKTSSEGQHESL